MQIKKKSFLHNEIENARKTRWNFHEEEINVRWVSERDDDDRSYRASEWIVPKYVYGNSS
jgi:hypothetical protein